MGIENKKNQLNSYENAFLAFIKNFDEDSLNLYLDNKYIDIFDFDSRVNLLFYSLRNNSTKSFYFLYNHLLSGYNDPPETSILHFAIDNNFLDESIFLINNNFDLERTNNQDLNILEFACENNSFNIIKLIINKNYNNQEKILNSILISIKNNNYEIFILLLNNLEEFSEETLIKYLKKTIQYNNIYFFKYLIEFESPNSYKQIIDNNYFLSFSIEYNSEDIFNYLISQDCNLNLIDQDGYSPLVKTIIKNDFNFFIKLINLGVDKKLLIKDMYNATHYSYMCSSPTFLKYLIDESTINKINIFINIYLKYFKNIRLKRFDTSYYDDESFSPKYYFEIENCPKNLVSDFNFISKYIIPNLNNNHEYKILSDIINKSPTYETSIDFDYIVLLFEIMIDEIKKMKI